MSDTKIRIQDDLYEAVNGEWLKTAVIPEDRPAAGGFVELDQNVEKLMMADFRALAEGSKTTDIPEMKYAVALYKKVLDSERRNREGIAPALPLLDRIRALKTVEDLNAAAPELLPMEFDLPLRMGVEADMADATRNAFVVLGPDLILPDTTYYAEDNESGKQLLALYADMAAKVLAYTPLTEEEQKQALADTLAFDALVAKKVKSQLEWSEYYKCHNPMPVDEVAELVAPFDIKGLLQALYGEKAPDTLIVYDPKAIREMKDYFSEENFGLYRNWAYVKALLKATPYLSEELATLGKTYSRALRGVAVDPSLEKQAYRAASELYAEPVGVYYGRTYFGEEAKKDVVELVKKIIETYKLRIRKNGFLAESTKEQAIRKLSTIEIKMGYPDEIKEIWSKQVFDENESLLSIMLRLTEIRAKDVLEKLLKPVDRTEWLMPGHMVNACYNPSANDITFPAAILQKPFYSLQQSVSENLGGIGAVIGHEISHAFDNNGANFDEFGNLKNWWTEEDFKAFQGLTQEMIQQFDGIEFHGGKVNGELTVSENIADNGGMGVTLEIMHTLPEADYRAYFMNWARVWCRKAKEEYIQLLLANDVHSPTVLRANMQPRNFPEWYEAFGVTETDGMYLPPEKRISIW
jgi:putative endopeptidase